MYLYLIQTFLYLLVLVQAQVPFELSIIHLNDFHAKFEPVSETTGTCHEGQNALGLCYGGISRIVTAVNELQQTEPNPVILNAGDTYQGSLLYTLFKWNITVEFMNRLPFDAYALGNHEFDDGISGVSPYLEKINAPVLAVNMDSSAEPDVQGKYVPSVVIQRGGRNIGIIGTITKYTPSMSSSENLVFSDELPTVTAEVAKLKSQGVDIIILLSHSGYEVDQQLAAQVQDIDIIVGAHSHSFLYTGTPPSIETPVGEYPTVVTQSNGHKVLIVQAYAYTKYLGFIKVQFDTLGEITAWSGNPKLLDSTVVEDPATKSALQPWVDEANVIGGQTIGTTAVYLDGTTCYDGECSLGSFLADAMVAEQVELEEDNSWTKAAIAIMNPGGIRASIGESPNVTYNDLVVAQPFANSIDTIELQGKDIVEILEMSASKKSPRDFVTGKGCMQVSGIHAVYNFSQPIGLRLINVTLKCANCRTPVFAPVDMQEWYTVAMPSYLSNGGSGFTLIPERGRNKTVGLTDVDVFAKYIEKESPIVQGVDGRIQVIT